MNIDVREQPKNGNAFDPNKLSVLDNKLYFENLFIIKNEINESERLSRVVREPISSIKIVDLHDGKFYIFEINAQSFLNIQKGCTVYATKYDNDTNFLHFLVHEVRLSETMRIKASLTTNTNERNIPDRYKYFGVKCETGSYQSRELGIKQFFTNKLKDGTPRFPSNIGNALKMQLNKSEKFYKKIDGDEQENAICSALNNYFTIIQGAPGTGKSQVACEIAKRHESFYPDLKEFKILIVSTQNVACDNLLSRCLRYFDGMYEIIA
ncbi:unnamed protein product [Chironomus riparius]|uniref:DNA2/NAM7 helicase helicase domain-containing protein n=1 Tax=Chironomus riparius TaxID=315576 RepID=A0A9N9S217_9DIPT|nr:unnamed protein product [Chironomus riparius]